MIRAGRSQTAIRLCAYRSEQAEFKREEDGHAYRPRRMRETHEDSPLQPDVHYNSMSVGALEGRSRQWLSGDHSISIVARPTIYLTQIRYGTLQGKFRNEPGPEAPVVLALSFYFLAAQKTSDEPVHHHRKTCRVRQAMFSRI